MGGRNAKARQRPARPKSERRRNAVARTTEPRKTRVPARLLARRITIAQLNRLQESIHQYLHKTGYPTDVTALSDRVLKRRPRKKLRRPNFALLALLHIKKAQDSVFRDDAAGAAHSALMAAVYGVDIITRVELERWRQSAGGRRRAEAYEEPKKIALALGARLSANDPDLSNNQLAEIVRTRLAAQAISPLPHRDTIRHWLAELNA